MKKFKFLWKYTFIFFFSWIVLIFGVSVSVRITEKQILIHHKEAITHLKTKNYTWKNNILQKGFNKTFKKDNLGIIFFHYRNNKSFVDKESKNFLFWNKVDNAAEIIEKKTLKRILIVALTNNKNQNKDFIERKYKNISFFSESNNTEIKRIKYFDIIFNLENKWFVFKFDQNNKLFWFQKSKRNPSAKLPKKKRKMNKSELRISKKELKDFKDTIKPKITKIEGQEYLEFDTLKYKFLALKNFPNFIFAVKPKTKENYDYILLYKKNETNLFRLEDEKNYKKIKQLTINEFISKIYKLTNYKKNLENSRELEYFFEEKENKMKLRLFFDKSLKILKKIIFEINNKKLFDINFSNSKWKVKTKDKNDTFEEIFDHTKSIKKMDDTELIKSKQELKGYIHPITTTKITIKDKEYLTFETFEYSFLVLKNFSNFIFAVKPKNKINYSYTNLYKKNEKKLFRLKKRTIYKKLTEFSINQFISKIYKLTNYKKNPKNSSELEYFLEEKENKIKLRLFFDKSLKILKKIIFEINNEKILNIKLSNSKWRVKTKDKNDTFEEIFHIKKAIKRKKPPKRKKQPKKPETIKTTEKKKEVDYFDKNKQKVDFDPNNVVNKISINYGQDYIFFTKNIDNTIDKLYIYNAIMGKMVELNDYKFKQIAIKKLKSNKKIKQNLKNNSLTLGQIVYKFERKNSILKIISASCYDEKKTIDIENERFQIFKGWIIDRKYDTVQNLLLIALEKRENKNKSDQSNNTETRNNFQKSTIKNEDGKIKNKTNYIQIALIAVGVFVFILIIFILYKLCK